MMELIKFIQEIVVKLKPIDWFLPQILFLYVGLIIVRRIASIPLGTIALLLTPLGFLPLYYWDTFDPAWYIKVLLWFLLVIIGFIIKGINAWENEHIQLVEARRIENLKEKIVKSTDPTNLPVYFLFLKSFAIEHLDTQTEEHFDLENVLRSALHPIDLIPWEKPNGMIDAEQTFIPNLEWQTNFEKLAIHARSILLIPSDHPGSLWEIIWLVEHRLLPSCIWLMPETPGWSSTNVNFEIPSPSQISYSEGEVRYDYAANWSQAVEALKVVGIKLPPYQARGMFFVIDHNGTASTFQPLALSRTAFRVRNIRQALKNLQDSNKSSKKDAYAPPREPGLFSKGKETLLFTAVGAVCIGYGLYQELQSGFSWSMLIPIAFGVSFLIPLIYEVKGSVPSRSR